MIPPVRVSSKDLPRFLIWTLDSEPAIPFPNDLRCPTPNHVTSGCHDVTSGSGDVTSGSNDVTSGSGDVTSGSGDVTSAQNHVTSSHLHLRSLFAPGGFPPPVAMTTQQPIRSHQLGHVGAPYY